VKWRKEKHAALPTLMILGINRAPEFIKFQLQDANFIKLRLTETVVGGGAEGQSRHAAGSFFVGWAGVARAESNPDEHAPDNINARDAEAENTNTTPPRKIAKSECSRQLCVRPGTCGR
jgi:hypothetical protein